MVEKVTVRIASLAFLVAILALPAIATAHALDEYLQAAIIDISPNSVQLEFYLTPGVAVADQLLAQIDANHDGVITDQEAATYTARIRRDLVVKLDGAQLTLKAQASECPSVEELHTGLGFLKLQFTATYSKLSSGGHKLTLQNQHLPVPSAYLFNAALPSSHAIEITRQTRNQNQSWGQIDFTCQPSAAASPVVPPRPHPWALLTLPALLGATAWWAYRKEKGPATPAGRPMV